MAALKDFCRTGCVLIVFLCIIFLKMTDFRQDLLLISQFEFSQDNVGQGGSEDEEESHGAARKGSYSL